MYTRKHLQLYLELKKFHNNVYGNKSKIITDHAALKEIFGPNKNTSAVACSRLQRWAVILSMYNYDIEFRKGSNNGNADALSRLPLQYPTEIEEDLINFVSSTDELKINFEKVKEESKLDLVLNQVLEVRLA